MRLANLDAEDVAFIVEAADLSATVRQQMRGPDGPSQHAIDQIGVFVLGVDFLTLAEGQQGGARPILTEEPRVRRRCGDRLWHHGLPR